MVKTVKEKTDLYLEFSDEEIKSMGWTPKQRLSIKINKDKSLTIKPWVKVDLDISNFSREVLEYLITQSLEEDLPVNDIIVNALKMQLNIKDESEEEQLICG